MIRVWWSKRIKNVDPSKKIARKEKWTKEWMKEGKKNDDELLWER